ncbi:hypothetical protein HDR58_02910 [bacterium]|nr:hypothetical protein [bacterium]
MVSQVGAIPGLNLGANYLVNPLNNNTLGSNTNKGNLFDIQNNPMQAFSTNTYDDDMMMPDFLKTNAVVNPQTTVQTSQIPLSNTPTQNQQVVAQSPVVNQPQFCGTEVESSQVQVPVANEIPEELIGCLNQNGKGDLTANGNTYSKTSFWRKSLASLGALAPLATRTYKLAKGTGTFKELFKFKPIAIVGSILAAAGWALGAMIDNGINAKRAAAADEAIMALQAQPQQALNTLT